MKRIKSILFAVPLLLSMVACGNQKQSVSISTNIDFATSEYTLKEMKASLEEAGYQYKEKDGTYQITFNDYDTSLAKEAYSIAVDGKKISITASDSNGLMYGGLDIAETLDLYGIDKVTSKTVNPDIEYRGLKFNCPLDMRTPSYSDGGDSAQENILNMWDLSFWESEFDAMALNRFNALSLWNLNPFPSMVKVADYPDVALNDVWRTTLSFDSSYNGTGSDLVRDEHWLEGNYEVIKTMTIDEKISHWQNVMSLAHSHGIKFYIYTWNIYTFGEHGKYGITCDQDNETTKDYYAKSVEALIDTYPDLDGIGIGAGENMKTVTSGGQDDNMGSGRGDEENETWLHDTYGTGIKNALAKTPNRDFEVIHRMHYADGQSLASIWSDLPCKFNLSDKYSIAHMYSAEKPEYINATLESKAEDQKVWLELRNDDIYYLRYGGYRFLKSLISQMPTSQGVCGFLLGSDGYIQGKEYHSTNEKFQGQMYIDKHWFNYMLIGRLGYQKSLDETFFKDKLACHFKNINRSTCDTLFEVMNKAGDIVPDSNILFFSSGDSWYVEGSWNNPNTFGYLTLKRLVTSKAVHPYANVLSIPEYCVAVENNETSTLRLPTDVITSLNSNANAVLDQMEALKAVSGQDEEFDQLVLDQQDFAYLGQYYAAKYETAINLRLYNDTDDAEKKTLAHDKATAAYQYWKQYADDMISRYGDGQRLSRAGLFAFSEVTADVEKDISVVDKWVKKTY